MRWVLACTDIFRISVVNFFFQADQPVLIISRKQLGFSSNDALLFTNYSVAFYAAR